MVKKYIATLFVLLLFVASDAHAAQKTRATIKSELDAVLNNAAEPGSFEADIDNALRDDFADSVWFKDEVVNKIVKERCVAMSDEISDIVAGTNNARMYFKNSITITDVYIWLKTTSSGGNVRINIREDNVSIFVTRPRIDSGGLFSKSSVEQYVFTGDTTIAANTMLRFDIDTVGSTAAGKGLVACIEYY